MTGIAPAFLAATVALHSGTTARAHRADAETAVAPLPESERSFGRVILGLNATRPRYVLMPDTGQWDANAPDEQADELRRQIYWLSLELQHGQIFRAAPRHTVFFVGVPQQGMGRDPVRNEERLFRGYLRERVGWSAETIASRVRFFPVPDEVPYAQDVAQALGYDARGRLVYALGLDCSDAYRDAIETLVRRYPNDFDVRRFPGLSTEGGDLDLVRLPQGPVALLVGYHRVRRYLETRYGISLENAAAEPARIAEGREAYRSAFGVAPIVVGEPALAYPDLRNRELFHLDMEVAVFTGTAGPVAFVPTSEGAPVDALTHVHLPSEMVVRLEREYDAVAAQMGTLGYRVVRLPFADHPVRSPVNVGKYTDPVTGRQSAILGRYPYHLELPGGRNPQTELQLLFETFDADVAAWRRERSAARWEIVKQTIARVWRELDRAVTDPNPIFEAQRRLYETNGVAVVPVPIYPTGEGGIHCLVLQ